MTATGPIRFDRQSGELSRDAAAVALTDMQSRIVRVLARAGGQPLTSHTLAARLSATASGVTAAIRAMRPALSKVGLEIDGSCSRGDDAGYRLIDHITGTTARLDIVRGQQCSAS